MLTASEANTKIVGWIEEELLPILKIKSCCCALHPISTVQRVPKAQSSKSIWTIRVIQNRLGHRRERGLHSVIKLNIQRDCFDLRNQHSGRGTNCTEPQQFPAAPNEHRSIQSTKTQRDLIHVNKAGNEYVINFFTSKKRPKFPERHGTTWIFGWG